MAAGGATGSGLSNDGHVLWHLCTGKFGSLFKATNPFILVPCGILLYIVILRPLADADSAGVIAVVGPRRDLRWFIPFYLRLWVREECLLIFGLAIV